MQTRMRNLVFARSRAVMAAIVTALVAISCSDNVTGPANTPTSLTLIPPSAVLRLGATTQLTAKGINAGGEAVTTAPVFQVADPSVVTVSSTGVVRGIKIGSTTVTAAFGSLSKSSTITVTAGYPSSVTKLTGDNASAVVSTAVSPAPSVQVKDSVGNP